MGRSTTVYTTVDIDVDFDDLDTNDLIKELNDRGYEVYHNGQPAEDNLPPDQLLYYRLIDRIYHQRRQGNAVDTDLDRLIYEVLGRIC